VGDQVSGTEPTVDGTESKEPRRAPFDEVERRVAREAIRASLFPKYARTEQIGRYRVDRRLGEGAMGLVFAARDTQLRRDVAIKILRGDLPEAASSDGGARLVREARALARLSHPNVVQIFDAGESDGRIYVAMELVEGETLAHWMREKHELAEIVDVFIQAARGLEAAHQGGLVHRDFKPGNVLVGKDGRVRVGDFGLVRRSHTKSPRSGKETTWDELTIPGTVMGTPAYMPPEQFVAGETDHRSDQFSFCVTLFEALFGERPFPGDSIEKVRKAIFGANVKFPEAAKSVPEPLLGLLRRGLSPLADERFPDMQPVVRTLESVAASLAPAPNAHGTFDALLAALPDGVESLPEVTTRADFVLHVLDFFPLERPPRELTSALASVAALGESDWVSEAMARLIAASAFDQHFRRLSDWRAMVSDFLRDPLRDALPDADWRKSDDAARLAAIAGLWGSRHRGTTLELVEHDADASTARLRLSHPAGLLDDLARVQVSELVRVGASLTRLGFAHVGEIGHDVDCLELALRWG
jgi:serine/threonine protein kinase